MDRFLEFLHTIIPYLHAIAAIAFIAKMILVFGNKGFYMPAVVTSFFRIYTKADHDMTRSIARHKYMRINNLINYYVYAWLFITFLIVLVFHSLY